MGDSIAQPIDRGLCEERTDRSATYSYNDPQSDSTFHAVIQQGVCGWLYSVHFYDEIFDTRIDGSCSAEPLGLDVAFNCAHAVVMTMWAMAQEAFNGAS